MDETDTPQNRSNDDAESKSSDENVSSEKKTKKNHSRRLLFLTLCVPKCLLRIIMAKSHQPHICVKCHYIALQWTRSIFSFKLLLKL